MALKDLNVVTAHKAYGDFENNTNISLRNKYVYLAVDKVANSTIKNCLFEIEYLPVKKNPVTLYDKRCSPLLSPYQLPPNLLDEVLNSGRYFRFAFVRNPYSRLLSCYLDRIQRIRSRPRKQLEKYLAARGVEAGEINFSVFVHAVCEQSSPQQNSHWRAQVDDILYDHIEYDFIGRFEHLWDDMAEVSRRIWGEVRPQMANPDVNKSPRVTNADSRLAEYYTPELADRVYERFYRDFMAFGYERELPASST